MAGLMLLGTASSGAWSAPYRPTEDTLVLERLPAAPPSARTGSRAALTPEQAASLAQLHLEHARRSGDPRFLGYAQGVLAPWWNQERPAEAVLLMRATLRQAQHDFTGALRDLDALLARDTGNTQAWLTQATVLRVLGRYPAARRSCARLEGLVDRFVHRLCEAALRGLSGELSAAAHALDALRPSLGQQTPENSAWWYAERADMAIRAGDPATAETLYRDALTLHHDDLDLRTAHADLLLDAGRADAVLVRIAADTPVESLRLRRALALHAHGDMAAFRALDVQIRAGFDAAQRRGESLHVREQARYLLATTGELSRALNLALANWAVQHEPWDVRLLIETARAAKRPAAAEPAWRWIAESGYEDARLPAPAPR